MPSNRQGDTAADTDQVPKELISTTTNSANKRFEIVMDCTEEEKVEFLGMTKTPHSFKETGQSDHLPDSSGKKIDLTPSKTSFVLAKEVEQIKKEHLVQTLQSLQYILTVEKPPKAQIILKSFNMPNPKPLPIELTAADEHEEQVRYSQGGAYAPANKPKTGHFTKKQKQLYNMISPVK